MRTQTRFSLFICAVVILLTAGQPFFATIHFLTVEHGVATETGGCGHVISDDEPEKSSDKDALHSQPEDKHSECAFMATFLKNGEGAILGRALPAAHVFGLSKVFWFVQLQDLIELPLLSLAPKHSPPCS
jgi:hypothetical protein